MIYRCLACGREEYRGCLPSVSCGLLLSVEAGMAGGLILLPLLYQFFPDGLGWWWLVAGPVLFVASVFAAVPIHFAFELIEYAAFALRRCPNCGARRWSWGFTRGFGL